MEVPGIALRGRYLAGEDDRLRGIGPVDQVDDRLGLRGDLGQVLGRYVARLPAREAGFDRREQVGHRDVADDDERRVVRLEPGVVEGAQGVEAEFTHRLLGPRSGQGIAVGVALTVEDARQDTLGHGHRLDLLAANPGELLLFQAIELVLGEGGIQDDVSEQVERFVEVLHQGAHRDARGVEVRASPERRAQGVECVRDLEGVAGCRSLIEHRHRHSGGAGEGELVRGVTGVEQQGEVDDGYRVAPCQDHVQAVAEFRGFTGGEAGLRELGDLGRAGGAVEGAVHRCVGGVGPYLDGQDAVVEPLDRRVVDVGDGRGQEVLLLLHVAVRAAEIDLARGEHVGLAAEAADPLDAANEARPLAGLGARELFRRRPRGEEGLEFLFEHRFHLGQVLSRLGGGEDEEHAAELACQDECPDVGRDLVVVDHPPVEAGALANAQDVAGQGEVIDGFVLHRGDVPDLVDPGLRNPVLEDDPARFAAARELDVGLDQRRPGGDVAEVLLDPRLHVLGLDVAGDHQDRVRRAVPGVEPLMHVRERGRVQVLHRSDRRVVVGVAVRIRVLEDRQEDLAVGLVLALPLLVLDDAALLVEPCLIDGRPHVAHPVGFHPQRHVERSRRHDLEVVRPVLVRRPVHAGGADPVEGLEVVVVEVLAAVEHQVLEQVREAGLAGFLVAGADVVPDVDGHDRRLVVLVDDQAQSVVEDVLGVGDVDYAGRGWRLARCRAGTGGEKGEGEGCWAE